MCLVDRKVVFGDTIPDVEKLRSKILRGPLQTKRRISKLPALIGYFLLQYRKHFGRSLPTQDVIELRPVVAHQTDAFDDKIIYLPVTIPSDQPIGDRNLFVTGNNLAVDFSFGIDNIVCLSNTTFSPVYANNCPM